MIDLIITLPPGEYEDAIASDMLAYNLDRVVICQEDGLLREERRVRLAEGIASAAKKGHGVDEDRPALRLFVAREEQDPHD